MNARFSIRFVAIFATVCTAFALAGCSSADARSTGLLSRRDAEQEYTETTKRLTLPAGAVFPSTLPATEAETMYEHGYAVSIAENYWICAWSRDWLSHRSDSSGPVATKAFAELSRAPETEFMRDHLDQAGRQLFMDYLARAGLGDPSGIQQYVTQNCPG